MTKLKSDSSVPAQRSQRCNTAVSRKLDNYFLWAWAPLTGGVRRAIIPCSASTPVLSSSSPLPNGHVTNKLMNGRSCVPASDLNTQAIPLMLWRPNVSTSGINRKLSLAGISESRPPCIIRVLSLVPNLRRKAIITRASWRLAERAKTGSTARCRKAGVSKVVKSCALSILRRSKRGRLASLDMQVILICCGDAELHQIDGLSENSADIVVMC